MKIRNALVVALLYAGQAVAHHAEAVFDQRQILSVTGTVKAFVWANPHSLIYLEVTGASGQTDVNVFEGGSAVVMKRNGWSRGSLKVGDKLAVDFHPRIDKKPGGQFVTATLTDGTKLAWRPVTTP